MRLLLIDNYDSFTHNLAQAFAKLGASVKVVRNDAVTIEEIAAESYTHIVLSPGPGHPAVARDFGVCEATIRVLGKSIPTLGVCLGHQGIVHVFGGKVVRAPEIVHGKMHPIRHNSTGLFAGLEQDIPVMRYHSLVAERESFPAELEVTAETHDGLIMGLKHRDAPLFGVQFHPESIGTPDGEKMLARFLEVS